MNPPSLLIHLRDIILLPFSVIVIIPYFILEAGSDFQAEITFRNILGLVLLGMGILLFFSTVYLFKTIGRGTLAPWQPTQKLVISGPYRYCRNPMISAVLMILLAETFLLASWNLLIWAIMFFFINSVYFRLIEEPALLRRFGNEYLNYKQNVPRWLARLKPFDPE